MNRRGLARCAALLAVATIVIAGCGGDDDDGGGAGGSEIVLGTSLPKTGALAGFGAPIEDGYKHAIEAVNAAGGIEVDGEKRKVRLVVRDNRSDANAATQQARSLILKDEAVGLLGAATPPLTIPLSNVAESQRVPLISTITPVRAWLAGNKSGWKYAWDMFFDEAQMTEQQFLASDLVTTNKKVALFTDTEDDGVVMGGLWTENAPKFGYEIAYHAKFPVGTTDFDSFIRKAQESGAEVVIAQMLPPDAFALWKQMKAAGYTPRTAFCEKCGNVGAWTKSLKETGEGTSAVTWWSPAQERPETEEFVSKFEGKYGNNTDLSDVVAADTAARVMLDAIAAAGSTDPAKINSAIGKTDKSYPYADVKFDRDHSVKVPVTMAQWTNGEMKLVVPKDVAEVKLKSPVAGLR